WINRWPWRMTSASDSWSVRYSDARSSTSVCASTMRGWKGRGAGTPASLYTPIASSSGLPSSAIASSFDLRGITNHDWPRARIGAFSGEVMNLISSLAPSLLGAATGIVQPQPPTQLLLPAGPAGGSSILTFSGANQSVFPSATPWKNGHWRMNATRSAIDRKSAAEG